MQTLASGDSDSMIATRESTHAIQPAGLAFPLRDYNKASVELIDPVSSPEVPRDAIPIVELVNSSKSKENLVITDWIVS